MGYKFSSNLLRGLNGDPDPAAQLGGARDMYWGADAVAYFRGKQDPFRAMVEDLNRMLAAAEAGTFGEDFAKVAAICVSMSANGDFAVLKSLYAINEGAVGIFLMRCMRVNNLATHSVSALKQFRKMFDAVGIAVSGDWDRCVEVASFGSTEFYQGTLTVAA